jgi:hypothetical protein
MSVEAGRAAFVVAVLVVLGWFAIGTHVNVRKGHAVLRWLQDGMPLLGERTTLRWLGSSGVELKVQRALAPLESAEVFLVLEPRDIPVLWWLFRIRGRRDLLILRGTLRTPPPFELEAFDRRAWSVRGIARSLEREQWTSIPLPPGSSLVAFGRGRADGARDLLAVPAFPELPLVRVAVRRSAPNLEVQWELRRFDGLESRRVLTSLHRLAERL